MLTVTVWAAVVLLETLSGMTAVPRATTKDFIRCPRCGLTSYNPKDIAERYCGYCHAFHDDMVGAQPEEASMAAGSLGAERVRESFNPSGDEMVDKIKRYSADLIDLCEDLKPKDPRLAALAQTYYETAAMYAVKCATTPEKS
jgi:ribosomal protein L37E